MIDSAMQGLDDMFGSSQNSTRTQTRTNTSRRPRNSGSSENHSRRHGFLLRFSIQGLERKLFLMSYLKSLKALTLAVLQIISQILVRVSKTTSKIRLIKL